MVALFPSFSTRLIKLGFLKSKSLVVKMLNLIGRCLWCREAWDKLSPFSTLYFLKGRNLTNLGAILISLYCVVLRVCVL